ncbi:oligopeptide/dipeptide ABC transporter ATP-binding protein [Halovivax sp.]|uniref:ABC transporter ATP-binding protein n=1 Tax=Halovivax sp. TaxID=1935978 RepID=UPI0025C72EBD|nr:oligopeptide/dipeptide ABC transporter ATP-binding protein [Halovivax sp.]
MVRYDEDPIVRVEGLKKYYRANEGFVENLLGQTRWVKAVDDVDLELYPGETLGIVGESGCGKSSLGQTMFRLIEPTDGSVYYRYEEESEDGTVTEKEIDLTEISNSRMRDLRKDLQYIFQDPFSSMNPKMTVGDIIGEPLDIHGLASGQERQDRVYELLEIVGLNPSHANRFPHEFSGGQRQRIGIARSLAVDPEVIICDEPVSALDVSVQAQILNLLEDLQEEFDLSYIFIAHDLSVVEHISDRVGVMYLGDIAEIGTTEEVFAPPHHPYAEALLSAIPEPDPLWEGDRIILPGNVPSPLDPPSGCKFHTRCPHVIPPEEYNLEQDDWRSLLDFKLRLRGAESIDAVMSVEEGTDTEEIDPADLDQATVDERVRREFGLPARIQDSQVEHLLSQTIEYLAAGSIEEARELVSDAFVSPCEVDEPEAIPTGGSQRITCHLYDDEYDRGQIGSTPRGFDAASADD